MPTLERLLAGAHEVALVVSQPDRPRGRGRALLPSPVSQRALDAGVPLLRPERVGDELPALARVAPDLGVASSARRGADPSGFRRAGAFCCRPIP